MPERIQLSRRLGWRKPDGVVVVDREATLVELANTDLAP